MPRESHSDRARDIEHPVILLGRGGGGTRILSDFAEQLGVFVGRERNFSNDSLEWVDLIYRMVLEVGAQQELPSGSQYRKELRELAQRFVAGASEPWRRWGWKLPETILVLPLVLDAFPEAQVVHQVRHPIDTCLRRTHITSKLDHAMGQAVLPAAYRFAGRDPALLANDPPYLHNAYSCEYQLVRALAYCRERLPASRYMEIRFEALCTEPKAGEEALATFLGLTKSPAFQRPVVDRQRARDWTPDDPRARQIAEICRVSMGQLGYALDDHSYDRLGSREEGAEEAASVEKPGEGAGDRAAALTFELDRQRRRGAQMESELARVQAEMESARTYQVGLERRVAGLENEITAAREFQGRLLQDIHAAREYQGRLEARVARAEEDDKRLAAALLENLQLKQEILKPEMPTVDILVVTFNSARWLDGFFEGLAKVEYPATRLRLVMVDNGSTDGTPELLAGAIERCGIAAELVRLPENRGFTGGYAEAFARAEAEFYFVVNADTVIAPNALERLVQAMQLGSRVGIAEARQSPREHPKYYDPITRETSWCSGACMLIRARAFHQLGEGFCELFFMYAEDVDLSWRMWLHGWKCIYVPEAVVQHFTEDLDPGRAPVWQHYFSMRNGALMRIMYGSIGAIVLHYLAMLRIVVLSRNPGWHRKLTLKAMLTSLARFPQAWRRRDSRARRGRHPQVFFNGWLYGRHVRDIALREDADAEPRHDLLAATPSAQQTLDRTLPLAKHIHVHPGVSVAGVQRPALVLYDSGAVSYEVVVGPGDEVAGYLAAPEEAWSDSATGLFSISQNGEMIWQFELRLADRSHRAWRPFHVPLRGGPDASRITVRFDRRGDLAWGVWGDLRIQRRVELPEYEPKAEGVAGPAISVIIPTHNRAHGLERVIGRLMSQDMPADEIEIILVDSNSQDDTPAVAARLAEKYSNVRTIRCDKPGAAAARNRGLDAARGPILLLMDDDILVGPDFLRRVVTAHRQHPEWVLLGRIIAPWEDVVDPFHRYLLQAQDVNIYNFRDPENVPADYFYTACVAIPRGVLGETRFDEGFRVYGVEDIEFGFRLLEGRAGMMFLPLLMVWHEYYPRYAEYRRKKYRAGYSLGYFLQSHPQYSHRFVFERRIRYSFYAMRAMVWMSAPLAGALFLWERVRYASGPVKRFLYRWLYYDIRLEMYAGLRRFRREQSSR